MVIAGIGLSIVEYMVEARVGKMSFRSKIDEGSTFEVVLPKFYFVASRCLEKGHR